MINLRINSYCNSAKYFNNLWWEGGVLEEGDIRRLVKMYKKLGGTYKDDHKEHNLERWMKEKWQDVGNKSYPVYRPTIRVNKNTPLTVHEVDKANLKKQIKLKQIIKGTKNLPPFKAL